MHVVVLRLPNSFRALPLPLSLALLGERLPSPVGPCSISPTTHPHPRAPPSLLSLTRPPHWHSGISPILWPSANLPRKPSGVILHTDTDSPPKLPPKRRISIKAWRAHIPFGCARSSVGGHTHSSCACCRGESHCHFLSPWESRLVCAHWCHREIRMTRMGSLLLAPT